MRPSLEQAPPCPPLDCLGCSLSPTSRVRQWEGRYGVDSASGIASCCVEWESHSAVPRGRLHGSSPAAPTLADETPKVQEPTFQVIAIPVKRVTGHLSDCRLVTKVPRYSTSLCGLNGPPLGVSTLIRSRPPPMPFSRLASRTLTLIRPPPSLLKANLVGHSQTLALAATGGAFAAETCGGVLSVGDVTSRAGDAACRI